MSLSAAIATRVPPVGTLARHGGCGWGRWREDSAARFERRRFTELRNLAFIMLPGESMNSTYRTIVVGVDGTDTSEIAVRRAAGIAAVNGAKLILVCSYDKSPLRDADAIADILKKDAYMIRGTAPADEILRTAAECAAGFQVGCVVRRAVQDPPVKALLAVAEETNADLLVIGDRGTSTAIRRRLGTVSDEAARKSRIDVLVVYPTFERTPVCRSRKGGVRQRSAGLRMLLRPRFES
ncbi:universal stress protein [Nocardia sp. NPDC051756]|uniref:universal stress protein n=1 Tax=Nocardia sp. NPDC051756 TaxID=3154751 RepID=UPI00343FD79D